VGGGGLGDQLNKFIKSQQLIIKLEKNKKDTTLCFIAKILFFFSNFYNHLLLLLLNNCYKLATKKDY
jgi:hypothetical protein